MMLRLEEIAEKRSEFIVLNSLDKIFNDLSCILLTFILLSLHYREVPEVMKCSVDGCKNPKKYSCSRTKLPVCGLACYRRVQQLHRVSPAAS